MSIIVTEGLSKTFQVDKSTTVEAVKDVNLCVEQGEIFGFLGPNGAGKSTMIRMMTTLLPPSRGLATVTGYDLQKEPAQIRQNIGVVGQLGGAKATATGREQLVLYGQLHGMSRRATHERIEELRQTLELGHFMDRPVSTYSGGQKRRLELALGIIHRPQLLFLDEPTTALDPQSRARLWDEIRRLRAAGTTVFLTTHYMDEADLLCDRIAVMDHGQIIAEDKPEVLKQRMSSDVITIELSADRLTEAYEHIRQVPDVHDIREEEGCLHLYVKDGDRLLPELLRLLDDVRSVSLARPTLDDVFLHLTGRSLRENVA